MTRLAFNYLSRPSGVDAAMRRRLRLLADVEKDETGAPAIHARQTRRYLACLRIALLRMLPKGVVFTTYDGEYHCPAEYYEDHLPDNTPPETAMYELVAAALIPPARTAEG